MQNAKLVEVFVPGMVVTPAATEDGEAAVDVGGGKKARQGKPRFAAGALQIDLFGRRAVGRAWELRT